MNEFKTYHPVVNFMYFASVIIFDMIFMHPFYLAVSLAASLSYSIILNGRKGLKFNILYMLPLFFITAILNPLFNHQGATIITYFGSGNPLTLESVLYGFAAAAALISVICYFSCYNKIFTSDKFIYLFGKIIPSLSLIFSMTLRFVPRFKAQFAAVVTGHRCIGRDMTSGTLIQRCKNAMKIVSIMVTWSLENAIDTADSMKSRGYGLPGRTSFSIFKFDKRDLKVLIFMIVSIAYIIIGRVTGAADFTYFPYVSTAMPTIFDLSVLAVYLILCFIPIIIEIREVRKWKYLEQKI